MRCRTTSSSGSLPSSRGFLPNEFLQDPEALGCYLPALRADFALCETYRYKPENLLVCPLTVYGASHDHAVSQEDLEAWRNETMSSCGIRRFDGDHYFIRSNPVVLAKAVAADLSTHLGDLSASISSSEYASRAEARDEQ
jgi:medium-chain acyl-[acyl-carrier-protein] hydrolase